MTTRLRLVFAPLALVAALSGCATLTEPEFERFFTLEVSSARVTCQDWYGPRDCLAVRRDGSEPWRPLYDWIEGFVHVEGVQVRLLLAEFTFRNPPADGSSRELRLVKVLSRAAVAPAP